MSISVNRLATRLKTLLPLSLRIRGRRLLKWRPRMPRDYASAAAAPSGWFHEAFRIIYRRRHFRRFFAELLRPGDLVFDAGANVGEWTNAFRSIGCRVIAIEPQAACANEIRSRYRDDANVVVVEAALAEAPGARELILSTTGSEHASLSREFVETIIGGGAPSITLVAGTTTVDSLTLPQLFDRFGVPRYLKLDIEGMEAAVLASTTVLPEMLSFEFHREWIGDVRSILARFRDENYLFNVTIGEWLGFRWKEWQAADETLLALEAMPRDAWGNVFVRRR